MGCKIAWVPDLACIWQAALFRFTVAAIVQVFGYHGCNSPAWRHPLHACGITSAISQESRFHLVVFSESLSKARFSMTLAGRGGSKSFRMSLVLGFLFCFLVA